MHCCTGDTRVSIATVKLQHEEKVAELRGTIGSDGTIALPGWMLEYSQMQLGRGIGRIPVQRWNRHP